MQPRAEARFLSALLSAAVTLHCGRLSNAADRAPGRPGAIDIHIDPEFTTDGRRTRHIHCSLEANLAWTLLLVLYPYLTGASALSDSIRTSRSLKACFLVVTEHREPLQTRVELAPIHYAMARSI